MSDELGKMDVWWRAKWLEALRSGRYRQADGALRSDSGDLYCCIGVLCDIYDPEKWLEGLASGLPSKSKELWAWDGSLGDMPEWLNLAIGLSSHEEAHLIAMNDDGKSFTEIADWIEANL